MPMKDLTPTQRAELHKKQLAEREERRRRAVSPGPGAYNTDTVDFKGRNGTLADMRGERGASWSFSSKSPNRRVERRPATGPLGPGAYEVTTTTKGGNDSLANIKGEGNMAVANFRSRTTRGSPFGSPDDPVHRHTIALVPSPANYSPQQDAKGRNWEVSQTKGENISQGNAVFASKSPMRATLRRDEKVPGPGTYEMQQDERGENWEVSSRKGEGTNQSYAFKSETLQRPPHKSVLGSPDSVGPGSYEPTATKTGDNSSVADMRGEQGSVAFLGNTTRLDISQWG